MEAQKEEGLRFVEGSAIRELFAQEMTSSWRPRDKCFNVEVALEDDVQGEMKLAKDR